MNAVIFPNFQKQNALPVARQTCDRLHSLGIGVLVDETYRTEFEDKPYVRFGAFSALTAEADVAIAIGGDGTILKCARRLVHTDVKLLGINTGRLGFMAALEADELSLLSRLADGAYTVQNRMMLRAAVHGAGETRVYTALNDVYASRLSGRISDFAVYADDQLIGNYRADGVVFSTPTGSTAYSLSAGGPIIEPDLACIEMTLICPHSLFSRPVLFAAERRIRLETIGADMPHLFLSVDGNEPVTLHPGEVVELTRSSHSMPLITMQGRSFFDTLNGKMMQSIKGGNGGGR